MTIDEYGTASAKLRFQFPHIDKLLDDIDSADEFASIVELWVRRPVGVHFQTCFMRTEIWSVLRNKVRCQTKAKLVYEA